MSYIYKTKGTCSTQIEVELDGNIVKNVKFTGGCQGNLQAIPRLPYFRYSLWHEKHLLW